jgi:DNA-binding transcriptional MerR regulator
MDSFTTERSDQMNPDVMYLRTVDAAQLLGVDPSTLRLWEGHYGFPTSRGPMTRCRQFLFRDILALRSAMLTEGSVALAIARVRSMRDGVDPETVVPGAEADAGRGQAAEINELEASLRR